MLAYRGLMRFANSVKVHCKDDNFENCLIVLDMVKLMNMTLREVLGDNKEKQVHVVMEAKNTFPSYLQFHSIELDESKQKTIQILSYPTCLNYRNFDLSNLDAHTWNAKFITFASVRFPSKHSSQKFPSCQVMKLEKPKNFEGIDFASMKALRRLEVSFGESPAESQLSGFFALIKHLPLLDMLRLTLPALDLTTFTALVVENSQRNNIEKLLEF